ncbi:hypothetical protein [Ferviditalea candida]|uniref:Uncharacterized protein n=1 Tax=Ferviditalea candida TaxID=3108399 RepID=A0ABU5ZEB1_9BACL|nr:hypothetical protein [Paenibacillaceae bacterium T2]
MPENSNEDRQMQQPPQQLQPPQQPPQIIYKANPSIVEHLKRLRDEAYSVCEKHIHKYVQIQTMDGHVIQGVIVSVDHKHVYLSVPTSLMSSRQFFYNPFYYSTVIPLVLFDLLAISLLRPWFI